MSQTKYIFVTGGVTSSLGKGIIAASLAKLLQSRGYRTTIQKLDPYINVDPGTLNPYEHGECFVTDDGAELVERLRFSEGAADGFGAVRATKGRIGCKVARIRRAQYQTLSCDGRDHAATFG